MRQRGGEGSRGEGRWGRGGDEVATERHWGYVGGVRRGLRCRGMRKGEEGGVGGGRPKGGYVRGRREEERARY